jgi:hypothetical protein
MLFWGLSRISWTLTPKAAGAACVLGCAILACANEGRAGELPSLDAGIAAEVARDFNVPTLTLPFQRIKCRLSVRGDCDGPAVSAAGIRLLTVILGPTASSRNIEAEQVCTPPAEQLTRAPESDTTTLGQKSYFLPPSEVREKLDQLLGIKLPEGSYENFQFVIIGAAQDQSDYPSPRFRREVADACSNTVSLLVTRLVRARIGLAFDQHAIPTRRLKEALEKGGFAQGDVQSLNLFVSTDFYLLGVFALQLSQTR